MAVFYGAVNEHGNRNKKSFNFGSHCRTLLHAIRDLDQQEYSWHNREASSHILCHPSASMTLEEEGTAVGRGWQQ